MYWCNISISKNKGKCVMAEFLREEDGIKIYRAWSNSSSIKWLSGWRVAPKKKGWYYIDVLEEELKFFDF
jgi:hypothetical protein